MKLSDIMSHAGLSFYAEVALVLFMAAFIGITVWTFRPANRSRYARAAHLPLDDNDATAPTRLEDR